MTISFKIIPSSGTMEETKNIKFEINGLNPLSNQRIRIENATSKSLSIPSGNFTVVDNYIESVNSSIIEGYLDLNIDKHCDSNIVIFFAQVEEKINNIWQVKDISAFAFQLNSTKYLTEDRFYISKSFISSNEKIIITVNSTPNNFINILINNKRYSVKTDKNGKGSRSILGLDFLSGSILQSNVMHKLPIKFTKKTDNFNEIYDSGLFVHFIPDKMKVLQATNTFDKPECAIFDRKPQSDRKLKSLDELCFDGMVTGESSIFDRDSDDSNFYDSRAGYCSDLASFAPKNIPDNSVCRIYNSISSDVLPNGSGIVAFASQYDVTKESGYADEECGKITLASRIFVAISPSSLKFKGNPVRTGSILSPSSYYHSVYFSEDGYPVSVQFRISDGTIFEISSSSNLSNLFDSIVSDSRISESHIHVVKNGLRLDFYSDNRFSVVVSGENVSSVCLNSNKTLEILTSSEAISDLGDTIVFLDPQLDSQQYSILSRTDKTIRIEMPNGVNNDNGPVILDNILCQDFVIIDSTESLINDSDLSSVSPLPYIKDKYQREIPSVYPSIASRKDYKNDNTYVYVVCQAPDESGAYQLFYYSFRLGDESSQGSWKQITFDGENKNAVIKCDHQGNLHIVWESDRCGRTQIYYSVLGSSSQSLNTRALISIIDKQSQISIDPGLLIINEPESISDSMQFYRMLDNNGAISQISSDSLVINSNPSEDGALAVYKLDRDENGNVFDGLFSQLSFQVSFDFNILGLPSSILGEDDLSDLYSTWVNQFEPIGNNIYNKNGNRFTIDKTNKYFDRIIPICGSYKFGDLSSQIEIGGQSVSGYTHIYNNEFIPMDDPAILAYQSNTRHFILGLIPEKIMFKASNMDTLSMFCENNELSPISCDGYIDYIESTYYTGVYKLAILLSTGEDESTGKVSHKKFHVIRQFGSNITLSQSHNIKVAVHYNKMSSNYIDGVLEYDRHGFEQDYRFNGNIIVIVDDEIQVAESFVADFSDQYRSFDIGFGVPTKGRYITNELLPYNGNKYDSTSITLEISNIDIGPHSISINDYYAKISDNDRNTKQMIVSEKSVTNYCSNGSFEVSDLPRQFTTNVEISNTSITDWNIESPITYFYVPTDEQPHGDLFYTPVGSSWISLSGYSSNTLVQGKISQTITTEIGKSYRISFKVSSYPTNDSDGWNITRTIKVSADSEEDTYDIVSLSPSVSDWTYKIFDFTATSALTVISFENVTSGSIASYAPLIDDIFISYFSDIYDELSSRTCFDSLSLSEEEFDFSFSLDSYNEISQIPITLSSSYQNRNPDIVIDSFSRCHISWQTNRFDYWDIMYASQKNRMLPFRYESRITEYESSSINPSISVDRKGRRLIAWQDNRDGEWGIYCAKSSEIDDLWNDPCKVGEIEEYAWRGLADPYIDPYGQDIQEIGCQVFFDFESPSNGSYHFKINFYTDKEKTNLFKSVDSRYSISGWRCNNIQISYDGVTLTSGETVTISYSSSLEDDLKDKVLYTTMLYQSVNSVSTNDLVSTGGSSVAIYASEPGLDALLPGVNAVDEILFGVVEYRGGSPISIDRQDTDYFTSSDGVGIQFPDGMTSLPGCSIGDQISVSYFKYESVTSGASLSTPINFNEIIVGIIFDNQDIRDSDQYFAVDGISYENSDSDAEQRGIEIGSNSKDNFRISEDRKTLFVNISSETNSYDSFRVITSPITESSGSSEFVFYCPTEQAKRCNINIRYTNDKLSEQLVNFRVTFYNNSDRESVIFSSFSLLENINWVIGNDLFPSGGITVPTGQSVNVIYDPEILPHKLYNTQSKIDGMEKESLLCGVPYYVVVEAYIEDSLFEIDRFNMLCECSYTNVEVWREDSDSKNWECSGQGGSDIKVSNSGSKSIRPKSISANNDLFYIVWEDYRYSRQSSLQSSLSPDYFFAIWDVYEDKIIGSGQGDFDRRITYFDDIGKTLYDASIFIDPFQNLNSIFHDGSTLYSKSCSIGCPLSLEISNISSCQFTDSTNGDFYVVGGLPERDISQYMNMRILNKYVSYSTYLDIDTPISVINDCFIELDIVGVPGTYAYRLKNDDDDDWSEWLPIGPDLPSQSTDEYGTINEREFFKAYFVGKDRFVAPWITSPNNGVKKICCEILTFFGKTESFCIDTLAIYKDIEYYVDFFFDETIKDSPIPKFNNYPIVGVKKTTTPISDSDLVSISENTESVDTIYVKITFKDATKIELLNRLKSLDRFSEYKDMTMDVYQQGINDQLGLPLEKMSESEYGYGVYRGSFKVEEDDSVVNKDGLAVIKVNMPGNCKIVNKLIESSSDSLDQKVSIFNDFTIFREKYISNDSRNSFGEPSYYKIQNFGSYGKVAQGGDSKWIGGGDGSLPLNSGGLPGNNIDDGNT